MYKPKNLSKSLSLSGNIVRGKGRRYISVLQFVKSNAWMPHIIELSATKTDD